MEGRAALQMKVTTSANIHFPALLSKLTFRLTNTENAPYFDTIAFLTYKTGTDSLAAPQ